MNAIDASISVRKISMSTSGCRLPKVVKSESQSAISGSSRPSRTAVNVDAF
jgi:hypothetical protein